MAEYQTLSTPLERVDRVNFAKVSLTFEGSAVKSATQRFEQDMVWQYNMIIYQLRGFCYEQAAKLKKDLIKKWDKYCGLAIQRNNIQDTPQNWELAQRQIVYKYFTENYSSMKSLMLDAISRRLQTVPQEMVDFQELLDDDWLKDLWEECGIPAIKKLEIPAERPQHWELWLSISEIFDIDEIRDEVQAIRSNTTLTVQERVNRIRAVADEWQKTHPRPTGVIVEDTWTL